MSSHMIRIHGVLVGENGIGKTSLVYALVGKRIPQEHIPTLMEIYCIELDQIQDQMVELVLTDTPGHDDYHKITQMALVNKDLVILCFSAIEKTSFESMSNKVSQEILLFVHNYTCDWLYETGLITQNKI